MVHIYSLTHELLFFAYTYLFYSLFLDQAAETVFMRDFLEASLAHECGMNSPRAFDKFNKNFFFPCEAIV